MRLNILTAVTRPENLPKIAESLAKATVRASNVSVRWRWGFDLERRHIGGQAVKNALIEEVPDGEWVWVLDDDTLAHDEVLVTASAFTDWDAIVFSQRRNARETLAAFPENVKVGSIDIGQAFLRREVIGGERIPEHYEGDGEFLAAVLLPARVFYHPAAFSLHNAISGVEVSV